MNLHPHTHCLVTAGGLTITVTRLGASVVNPGDYTLLIMSITNPTAIGLTGEFTVSLLNLGVVFDTNTTVPGIVIAVPLILGAGPNHSMLCAIDSNYSSTLFIVLGLVAVGLLSGIKLRTV